MKNYTLIYTILYCDGLEAYCDTFENKDEMHKRAKKLLKENVLDSENVDDNSNKNEIKILFAGLSTERFTYEPTKTVIEYKPKQI